jgi:hypothetical protein
MTKMIVFNGEKLTVRIHRYTNAPHNTAIQLVELTGMPYTRATINPETLLGGNCVAIKDYTENKGIMRALIEGGIISESWGSVEQGFVKYEVCKLLWDGTETLDEENEESESLKNTQEIL